MNPPGAQGPPAYVTEARRLIASGDPRAALALLERVLNQHPRALPAMRVTAETLLGMGAPAPALRVIERFRSLAPQLPIGHLIAAQAQELLRRYDDAAESLEKAHELKPENPNPPALRARLAERANELEEARVWVDRALSAEAEHPIARLLDAKLAARAGSYAQAITRLRSLASDGTAMARLAPMMRATVHHELGNALDKSGDYTDAWSAYRRSADARDTDPAWANADANAAFERIARVRELIASGFLERCQDADPDERPGVVFLVGLPRSGTTLTEQTLAKHADLVPTDEQTPIGALLNELRKRYPGAYPGCLESLTDADAVALRRLFFEHAERLLGPTPAGGVILDKLPLNLMDLPLLARVFPSSPLIVALRDPLDACLSNAQQLMQPNPSMKSLGDLGSGARFAAELLGLWCDARERLRMPWTESRYEAFVAGPEPATRRLIGHCGLAWRNTDSHAAAPSGIIGTPSYEAVAGAINTRAVGRWPKYADAIDSATRSAVEGTLADVRRRLGYSDG